MARADIVSLADLTLVQNQVHRSAMITYVLVIAHLPAVSVDWQRFAINGIGGEQRHDLLRILVGANIVGPPTDSYR